MVSETSQRCLPAWWSVLAAFVIFVGSSPLSMVSAEDEDKVDVFVAAGKMGRTVMSINDGVSWIHDLSDDDSARCWCDKDDPRYVECDHDPRSFTGLDVSADGWFYA